METKFIFWHAVIATLTAAYILSLAGVYAGKKRNIEHHSRFMIVTCFITAIWLAVYICKQFLFGREKFHGDMLAYWVCYVPLFTSHMLLAGGTIAIAVYNLYTGLSRMRHGSIGAMASCASRHRRLGRLFVWTFSGTMATAYLIYIMLFVLFRE